MEISLSRIWIRRLITSPSTIPLLVLVTSYLARLRLMKMVTPEVLALSIMKLVKPLKNLSIELMVNLLMEKKSSWDYLFPKKERQAQEDASPKWTNIFVKNLSKAVDDVKLNAMFSKYGSITSAILMKDDNGGSKGFGFINFLNHHEAQASIEEMNSKDIDGLQLYVGRAQKKGERERDLKDMFEKLKRERMSKYQGVNLYVKNLEETIDDAKLRQEFSQCGTITSAKVMHDDKGVSKGFGFVCFSTPDEATKSVTEMNGKMLGTKPIYVALAQRKELRRAQLEAQHAIRANGIRMQQQAQASGMTGSPMYAPGAPVFYQGPRGGFMYQGVGPRPGYPVGFQPRTGYQVQSGFRGNQRGGPQQRGGNRNSRGSRGGPYPGIKYNANVRNPQQPVQEDIPDPMERKQMLGETLYPLIEGSLKVMEKPEELAGKITGMLLEIDPQETANIIENQELLRKKVTEALDVLAAAEKEGK